MAFGSIIIGDEILTGKRQDKHFGTVVAALARRGLELSWSTYLQDEPALITDALARALSGSDIVFSFGGIGATPDDHTRQCAAAAGGVELALHPDAEREIRARFGGEVTPHRLAMGTYPAGSSIIPNPYNRIPGFTYRNVHFFPGFPQMAWPMLEWVLDTVYPHLARVPEIDVAILVFGAGESQLIDLMNACIAAFPHAKLFSLPRIGERAYIELGVRGDAAVAELALAFLRDGVARQGFSFEPRATLALD
ncbi:MAG: competence/damage-inducible protein A [Proteobacteria bacterium]|nr:competence/damage-inducible protein A [Burkholderiales bacterium]